MKTIRTSIAMLTSMTLLALLVGAVAAADLTIVWNSSTELTISCPMGQVYYDNGHGETFMGNCGDHIVLSSRSGSLSQKPIVGATVTVKDTSSGQVIYEKEVPWHTLHFPVSAKAS